MAAMAEVDLEHGAGEPLQSASSPPGGGARGDATAAPGLGAAKVFSGSIIERGSYDLTTVNLRYTVSKKRKGVVEEKVLLNNVSARARRGEILAVVGPSGAGKSTFLDAVAGRIRSSSLQGDMLLNGKPVDAAFRRISGYVMQDDQLFPMLTVRETLMFSARLRLPNSLSGADKAARVEAVIQDLGLASCADTIVGNAEVRGVSGGEKRRVSIGVDLIHDPAVLFLDEPTSGLDSTAALAVAHILHDLAEKRQRTIVLTIHQPSFRILELIHNFLILARGNVVYHGPYAKMSQYFSAFTGQKVVEQANGLEYALDVIEEAQQTEEGLQSLLQYAGEKEASQKDLSAGSSIGAMAEVMESDKFATGFLSEVAVLADRTMRNIVRTKELFLARAVTFIVSGLIIGSIFLHSPHSPQGVNDRISFFAFSIMALLFTSIEALPIFLEERQIYIRETSRGAYRTSSYVIAGTLAFLPVLFAIAVIYSLVTYFMIGLAPGFSPFCTFVAGTFLTLAVANSFVLFIGGFVPNFAIGVTLSTAITAFFFLCSGFFIASSRIPKYWIWLNWISTFKYPLQLLTVNEFRADSDVCWDGVNTGSGAPCQATSQDVLDKLDMGSEQVWVQAVVLVGFFIIYRVFFYFLLRLQTKSVRK